MTGIQNQLPIPPESKWTKEEWNHLCLMHRIITYLAEYHNLPLEENLPANTGNLKTRLLDFYETYHIPFELLVKTGTSPVEALDDCLDQVYLFLSSLVQTYELDWADSGIPEKEAFLVLFHEKTQSLTNEASTQCVQLGFYTQMSDQLLICDPSANRNDPNLVCLHKVDQGMWRAAVQVIKREDDGGEDGPVPAFLLAKSQSCPFSFQQMQEQAFLWPKKQNIFTDLGMLGLFDKKYYQDPTSFGIPPIPGEDKRWIKACNDLLMDYPNACVLPHGAISCSGEGEGLYDAYYLKNSEGYVIAVVIDFLLYGEN